MWNLINPSNSVVVNDFWNGGGDVDGHLEAWANNNHMPAGRYIMVGNHERNKGSVIFVDVSDVKLEREVKIGNRKISPDVMFDSCLVVNGAIISTSFDGRMIEMIAELNSDAVEFYCFDRDTLESVPIVYYPGGMIKKVKLFRVA